MPEMLTSAEVECGLDASAGMSGPVFDHLVSQAHTIIALAQALADSPCPVCRGRWIANERTPDGIFDCSHCGDFTLGRRGRYAETWQDALDTQRG